MAEGFGYFGGIDFSGAKEPLSNLWTAVGEEREGRLCITTIRPHAFRADLAAYVAEAWRNDSRTGTILWGADFPFGLPTEVGLAIGAGSDWSAVAAWVADRPPDEIRSLAGDASRALRRTEAGAGAMPPLDLRLYKQTAEGIRWLHELREEYEIAIEPQARQPGASATLIEVHPSGTAQELGLPRRRSPSRPGEVRARAAALRTYLDFEHRDAEALAITLEDAWDATLACLTAYLCRDDLQQPYRTLEPPHDGLRCEGWIYRPPASLA